MIDLNTGVSLGALVFAASAFGWLWNRLANALAAEVRAREAVATELATFKLEATRTFATAGAIEKTEQRLTIAIEKMTARLETVIGRIEALSNELVRVSAVRVPRKTMLREAGD